MTGNMAACRWIVSVICLASVGQGLLPLLSGGRSAPYPVLAASICEDGPAPDTRLCAVCGRPFLPEGRQAYCSEACKAEGNQKEPGAHEEKA